MHTHAATRNREEELAKSEGADRPDGVSLGISGFREDSGLSRRPLIGSKGFSVYYGNKAAVKDVSFDIPEGLVTAIIGPSGCGKSTFLRAINRMNDLIPGCRTEGDLTLDDQHLYAPQVDVVSLRKRVGMVFQKPNPFPKSIFDNVAYGPRIHGTSDRGTLAEIVERSLKQAALWDEVKDRLQRQRPRPLRRAAAAALHRQGSGGGSEGPADGRADLRARSPVHIADRGPYIGTQG